jgi:hypothetical protein
MNICFPKIVIPNLFSIPNINDVQGDPRSSAYTHITGVERNSMMLSYMHSTRFVFNNAKCICKAIWFGY